MHKYSLKTKLLAAVNIIIFILFLVFSLNIFFKSDKSFIDYLMLLLYLLMLLAALYYEYLKYLYQEALYSLNFKLDTERALNIYNKLCRIDITKTYAKKSAIFPVMLLIEDNKAKDALKLIKQNEKQFRSSVELLAIMYYYQIRAYLILNNAAKVNEVYSQFQEIAKLKKRPKIIDYDEVEALHALSLGNKKKAYDCFKKIKLKKRNPKEIIFIWRNLAALSSGTEQSEIINKIKMLEEEIKDESKQRNS